MLAISIFVLQNIVQKKERERERCEGVCVGKKMSCVGKRKERKKESQLNLIGICLIVDEEEDERIIKNTKMIIFFVI